MVALSPHCEPFFVDRVPRVITVSSEGSSLGIFIEFRKFWQRAQEAESLAAQPLRSRPCTSHLMPTVQQRLVE